MDLEIKDETGKQVALICEKAVPNVIVRLIRDSQKNLTLSIDNKGKVFFTVTNPFQNDFLISASDDESSMLNDVIIVCHIGYTISCR